MPTPISNSDSYASPADLLKRFDARVVGDLCRDDGTRESASAILANSNVLTALSGASGRVERAAFVGEKYSAADLAALTGPGLDAIKDLVCGLAMVRLYKRRFPLQPTPDSLREHLLDLEALRNGEQIFALADQADAGLPENSQVTEADICALGLVTDLARPYWGIRGRTRRLRY